jgi:putative transposase
MINKVSKTKLPKKQQAKLICVSRSSLYRKSKDREESLYNQELLILIDKLHLDYPAWGSRKLTSVLKRSGHSIGRKRVRRLMHILGIRGIAPGPKTTKKNRKYKVYPYLLRGLNIVKPNQVWCTDITYIPMPKGHVYLVAIMDWYSRKILSWRISNTMTSDFCVSALEDAIEQYGAPEIFNTDQGSQFTSIDFTTILKETKNTKISMDGKGCWVDNVFIERLWRSLKYEEVYLNAYEDVADAKLRIGKYLNCYNTFRPHASLNENTPDEVYYRKELKKVG